ncbi:MAG TPA: GntR family transcriptional regulator [Jiangellales bacterium]|nr:GntR family transcriptional regulator [Jiangellales bacterium]
MAETSAVSGISVDRSSPVPLYFQLASELQRLIESGEIVSGTRLDNEIALADQLGVSRPTMRRAIQYLVERGLLVRKRGVGTQVVRASVQRPLELSSLYDDLSLAGRRPSTRVLVVEKVSADDAVASALGLDRGTTVVHLQRLRLADDEPIALLTNYLPPDVFDLSGADLETRGLYELLRSGGVHIRIADQSIGARNATAAEARLLGETRGAALLTMTRTAYDDVGRAVEYGTHVYRGSRYAFSLTLVER